MDLSKSGLHQRFGKESVQFLTKQLEKAIASTIWASKSLKIFHSFNRILVFDSSGWKLRKGLKGVFKGSGGSASPAGCKIQCGFDLKSSTFSYLDITPGNEPDQKHVKIIQNSIKKGDLFLADLGYFCLRTLAILAERKAFFLLRYLHGTTIYLKNGNGITQKLDLLNLLKKSCALFELDALLGSQTMLPCRLICLKLSDVQLNQKLRRLNKNAKKRQRVLSKTERLLARWEIFVTNAPILSLSSKQATQLYHLRWTIELIFKQFKSTLAIHQWNHANEFRLQCEILGTLIIATIIFSFHNSAQSLTLARNQQEISIEKLFKLFKNSSDLLLQAIHLSKLKLSQLFHQLFLTILSLCLKESRPSRPSSLNPFLINSQN